MINSKEYGRRWRERNRERLREVAKKDYQLKKDILKQNRLEKKWSQCIYHSSCDFYIRRALLLPPKQKQTKPQDKDYFKKYYAKNKDKIKAKYHKLRDDVYDKLGNKCACCGFSEKSCLQLDHINNDGAIHRKYTNTENQLKDMLNGFVQAQLLCGNCHNSKTKLGECYHKAEKKIRKP